MKNNLIKERQDVACSEGEAVTELSPSSGSPIDFSKDTDEIHTKRFNIMAEHLILLAQIRSGEKIWNGESYV